jgi:hypothetical protein
MSKSAVPTWTHTSVLITTADRTEDGPTTANSYLTINFAFSDELKHLSMPTGRSVIDRFVVDSSDSRQHLYIAMTVL